MFDFILKTFTFKSSFTKKLSYIQVKKEFSCYILNFFQLNVLQSICLL